MPTKIIATCAILEFRTDKILSERKIGEFNTHDEAAFAAHKERKTGESVVLYNVPEIEEEEMSVREMAERDYDWNEYTIL